MTSFASVIDRFSQIDEVNEQEVNELRQKVYSSLKTIFGAMTRAAEYAGCSTHQLRLVLRGVDKDAHILLRAAEWLLLHKQQQANTYGNFIETARAATAEHN